MMLGGKLLAIIVVVSVMAALRVDAYPSLFSEIRDTDESLAAGDVGCAVPSQLYGFHGSEPGASIEEDTETTMEIVSQVTGDSLESLADTDALYTLKIEFPELEPSAFFIVASHGQLSSPDSVEAKQNVALCATHSRVTVDPPGVPSFDISWNPAPGITDLADAAPGTPVTFTIVRASGYNKPYRYSDFTVMV